METDHSAAVYAHDLNITYPPGHCSIPMDLLQKGIPPFPQYALMAWW